MQESASFLSHLLLRGHVTLKRMFQIELSTLHFVESRSPVGDLTPQLSDHSVPSGQLRFQDFAVVTRVAYRLFESIDSWSGNARHCLDNFLALAFANLK